MSGNSKSRKRVLFVDDSADFLDIFSQTMEVASKGEWEVLTAHNAAKALEILDQQHGINLTVIDSQMPLVDGLQLLRLIGRKYPHMPKAILTGFPNEGDRQACLTNGADLYLHKPTNADEMQTIFATLNELARVETEEIGFQGTVRRVGLHDILQMECLGRNSGVLEIFNKETRGEIFIKIGSIIHAQTDHLSGVDAFNHLLAITGGGFKLKAFVEPPSVTIDRSWEFLLMEASRQRDELAAPDIEMGVGGGGGESEEFQVPEQPFSFNPPAPPAEPTPIELPRIRFSTEKKESVQINEMAIFSSDGQVLYEWQCTDIEMRRRMLEFVTEKSKQLSQSLGLGRFDLVEIHSAKHRMVAQIQDETGIYIEVGKPGLAPAAAQ